MGAIKNFVKGAATVLPEIRKPVRKPSLNEKLIWTGIAVIVYMVMAVTPLTGVAVGAQSQFSYSSIIFASQQGTLMTLGIGPIVTAGLILQLLAGSEIIRIDFQNPEDRAIFTSATKLLTMIVIVVEASAYLIGGLFGTIAPPAAIAIFFELFAASVIVMLLDELVQKGWGIGSGVSLFILAGVAQRVMWDIFSPLQVPVSGGGNTGLPVVTQVYGGISYLISSIISGNPADAFFRVSAPQFPSIFGLIMTIVAMLIIVYVEGMRIEIPITSTKYRGFAGTYPIKLLYVSNIPVILFSALIANISFFGAYLWKAYNPNNTNPWFNWFVRYNSTSITQGQSPLSYQPLNDSLIYYMTSPRDIFVPHPDYLRALTYVLFAVVFSVMFARIWVEIGGLSPKAAAKSLIGADVMVPGFRRTGTSVEAILSKYIPVITILGGIFIGLLASVSDILGVYGTGVGLLLMIDIIIQYYQMLVKEQLESMMPRLGSLLGRT
ncbi:MAG: preprotein translocase subunit SecY [Thaumarchaeota archaeon]|nr:preprotein translocase subunit SecY [Nitrososphaerota archaeon]MCL5066768.1 preprotein translocase subunit SecY [Nitrososphaerota archaeon]